VPDSPVHDIPLRSRPVIFPGEPRHLPAMVTGVGHEDRNESGYDWHGLRRGAAEFALWQYTLQGMGALRYEDGEYDVRPGTAMLLTFPHDNRYWLPRGGRWRFFFLCLRGPAVMAAWRTAITTRGPLLTLDQYDPLIEQAGEIVSQGLRDAIRNAYHASALAYGLTMRLHEHLGVDERNDRTPRRAPIAEAMRFAQTHLHEPIGVDDLAHAAGLSRYHFSRLFRQSEGVTPAAFVERLRLGEAARRLQADDAPIKAIARQCGYRDPNYFAKAFRRAFGLSPTEFRHSGMYGPAI